MGGGVPGSFIGVVSLLGAVTSAKRDGVRVEGPHYLEQHNVHRVWTKENTWHWETGSVFHLTSGQVLHVDANLIETHVNASPIQVHMGLMPIGVTVHAEASHRRKHINLHGGHHHHLVSNFHQSSQAVHIESTTRPLSGWDEAADFLADSPEHRGTMTLEADKEMRLETSETLTLAALQPDDVAPLAAVVIDKSGEATLYAKQMLNVASDKVTLVKGGSSEITLQNGELKLKSGKASVALSDGNLTTTATETKLNGRVTLGQPATSDIASKEEVEGVVEFTRDVLLNELDTLKAEIAALRARLG